MLSMKTQRYTSSPNGMGGSIQAWTDYLSFDGVIDLMNGDEQKQAEQMNVVANYILLIFDIIDIKKEDRVIHDNKRYVVKFVDNPMNMDRHLEVLLEYKGVDQDGV